MPTIVDDEWIIDTEALLCSNNLTKIVVGFTKSENIYFGKIKEMPIELMARMAKMKDGEKFIEKAVFSAEEIFNKEMFDMRKCKGMRDNVSLGK